ncbi:MAG: hypothetical protein AAFQ64_10450 [Pseudomonadota bacterium]
MSEPEIPPGHTKPPMKTTGPFLQERERKVLHSFDPRGLPRKAKGVLLLAAGLSCVAAFFADDGGSLMMIAVICAGAYGEAVREVRDARDDDRDVGLLPDIYERALANAYWVGFAMLLGVMIGNLIRRVTVFEGMMPG